MIEIIFSLIIIVIIFLSKHPEYIMNDIEHWRDLKFIGNKDINTYSKPDTTNYSRSNLPIYYPISSPLEDTYFNYINSISSPKLSMFRNILRSVEVYSNEGMKPIKFNYAERPIENKEADKKKIKYLADQIINMINKYGDTLLKVELDGIRNEIHEETDTQSRMNFDMKLKLIYQDSEKLGKNIEPDIVYIQPEFIFERKYTKLPEDKFFEKNNMNEYNKYLSKIIVIGAEHAGLLAGRFSKKSHK